MCILDPLRGMADGLQMFSLFKPYKPRLILNIYFSSIKYILTTFTKNKF